MARGVNKVILVGNIGSDPEVRYTHSGTTITELSIATSEKWKDKNTGQDQERTEWHRVTLFGRLGEIAGEYCKKGSQVFIEGSIRTDKYQDRNTGEDRYSTKVIASSMQLLGSRNDNGNGGYQRNNQNRSSNSQNQRNQSSPPPMPESDFDDDIPF